MIYEILQGTWFSGFQEERFNQNFEAFYRI